MMRKMLRTMYVVLCEAFFLPIRLLAIVVAVVYGIVYSIQYKTNGLKTVMEGFVDGYRMTLFGYRTFIKYGKNYSIDDVIKEMGL